MSVIGSDSRQVITSFTTFPFSTVTAVDIQRTTGNFIGSGIVIGPNHVLTAGHNDYSTRTRTRATALRSTISANEDALNSRVIGNANDPLANVTNVNFLANYNTTRVKNDDIALFTVNNGLLPASSAIGLIAFVDPESADNLTIDTAGYPGDNVRSSIPGNTGSQGRDLVRSPGATEAPGEVVDILGRRFFYSEDVDTFKGQSGSGIWHTFKGETTPRVIGVHTQGTGGDNRFLSGLFGNRNSGVLITTDLYQEIVDQMETDNGNSDAKDLPENIIVGTDPGFFSFFTGSGDDQIIGSYRRERILGQDGDDQLLGGGADDRLEGGGGVDQALFSDLFTNYDFTITDPSNPAFEFDHTKGTKTDGKDTTKDIEFGVFEYVDADNDGKDDDGDLFFVPLQVDPNDNTKLKDGPEIDPDKDILNDEGKKIGTITVESPAWMFDGDVDYSLTIGSEQGILYNFAYIIDVSGSMLGTPLAEAKAAYQALTQELIDTKVAKDSKFAVIPFNSSATLNAPLNANAAISAINALSAGGGTEFGPALQQAQNFFPSPSQTNSETTNIAYFLSDGFGSGASADLQAFAEVRAFGIGSADLTTLNIIDSDNAVLLSDPADLITEFKSARIDRDIIEKIEVKVNGVLADTISPDQLQEDTLGLKFEGSIKDLEVTRDAENEIVFDLIFNDGTPTTSLDYKITTGQKEVKQQSSDGTRVVVLFSVNQSDYTGTPESEKIIGNDLDNVIDGGEGDNTLIGHGGNDRFILSGKTNLVDGGDGIDTVVINQNQADAGTISQNGNIVNIGTDNTLLNVEFIEFNDFRLAVGADALTVTPILVPSNTGISVTEGDANSTLATVTINLSSAAPNDVVIDFVTRSNSADVGADFLEARGQLTIAAGDTSGEITVEILGDTVVEGNEPLFLDLTAVSGGTFADGATTATVGINIIDDDTAINVPITGDDPTVTEGNPGAPSTLTLTLDRFGGLTGSDTIEVEITADGTNPAQADDFVDGFATYQVTFAPGESTKTVDIPIAPDTDVEGDETFGVKLTSGAGTASLPSDALIFTILNDDVPPPPDAIDDGGAGFTTDEDTSFTTGNVLTNDQNAANTTVTAIDTTNTNGTVTNNGDGTFRYDPNGQFEILANGEIDIDTFTYTISDGQGGTDTATVSITVNGITDATVPDPLPGPTPGDDVLIDNDDPNFIDALAGNDRVFGNGGDDALKGGEGDDRIFGGNDNDDIFGDEGNDRLFGDRGLNTILGGDGDDRLYGGNDADDMFGGAGNDRLFGNGGENTLYGDLGIDRIYGGAEADLINGGEGDDWLFGNGGDDVVLGEEGDDRIYTDAGDDYIDGGAGNDYIRLNGGNDLIVLAAGQGTDTIDGFQEGATKFRLVGGINFSDLTIQQSSKSADIYLNTEFLAAVNNTQASKLTQSSFVTA